MTLNRQTIASALDALADLRQYDHFQELAFQIAKAKWTGLHLTHKVHDRGADAIDETGKLILACGWKGTLDKLKEDCETIKTKRPGYLRIVFATSVVVSESKQEEWSKVVKTFGLELVSIIHRDWIIGELERPENLWIAHRYLELPIGNFADMATHLPRVKEAAHRIQASWNGEYSLRGTPHLDTRVELTTVGSDEKHTEAKVSELNALVRCSDLIWVTGPPGIGKTQTLIEIGRGLLDEGKRIPLFVSLRGWAMQEQPLIDFMAASPAMKQQDVQGSTLAFAIEAGHVVLLLNGWNEIPNERQERLKVEFRDLLGQSGGATIIVSSRSMPEVKWSRANQHWRLCELSDDEITTAVLKSKLPAPLNISTQILANWQLATMARIPLFLWELLAEARDGNHLPSTRFTLMDRMVKRACSEHEDATRIEGQNVAPKLLGALAIRLTDLEKTEDTTTQILPTITAAIRVLREEGELSVPPPSLSVLTTLANSHLIIFEEGKTSVRFSHQLVQEFFAARKLASEVVESGILSMEARLAKWAWAVPIQMCIECLGQNGHTSLAASLVAALSEVDLDAACRAVGANPVVWEGVRGMLEARIRSLAASGDINARWLAARSAAATGQPTFKQIVFEALEGLPAKSEFVYAGLPIDIVFRSLGHDFTERLSGHGDNDFRFRALTHLAETGSFEGIQLARRIALNDPDPILRRNAYRILFTAGDTYSWRPFLAEVKKQGGWGSGLLLVAKENKLLRVECWRKLQLRLVKSIIDWRDRKKTYIRWLDTDRDGANPHAKAEYEWCIIQSKNQRERSEVDDEFLQYRVYLLSVAAVVEPEWTAEQLTAEVAIHGIDYLGDAPFEVLTDEQRAKLVEERIQHVIGVNRGRDEAVKKLAKLAPETAARWILRQVSDSGFMALQDNHRWSIKDTLQQVDRATQLKVSCEPEFEWLDKTILPQFIDTLMRSRGYQQTALDAFLTEIWRQRLEVWMRLLLPVCHDSAFSWANIALLLGEVGRAEDAPLLIQLLKADETQVQRRIAERNAVVEAYLASGRRTKPPGGIDHCSHQLLYHQALWQLEGESVCREISCLVNDPRELAFAAHWLASHFGAPRSQESSFGSSRYRYDLIYERRHRSETFVQSTSALVTLLKQIVVQQLGANDGTAFRDFADSVLAVARFEGAPAGVWIMDLLELHFPEGLWDGLLHDAIVVGAEIPGQRLLPFFERTIHAVLHPEYYPVPDQTWRVRQIISALFYTDTPELAVRLLNSQCQSIFRNKDHEIRQIMWAARWSSTKIVDDWLKSFFNPVKSAELKSVAMQALIDRIIDRKDFDQIPCIACQFVELGDLRGAEGAWSTSEKLAKVVAGHQDLQMAILAEARAAPSLEHAKRWLHLIIHLGLEETILTAFDLTEQWGESSMNVVSSLYPAQQDGTTIAFHGDFSNWRRSFHRLPKVISRLRAMTHSPDPTIAVRSQGALYWIERERLGGGLGST